jgi:hypothetical protein
MMADGDGDDLAAIHDAGFGAPARAAAPTLLGDLRQRGVGRGAVGRRFRPARHRPNAPERDAKYFRGAELREST